METIQTEIVIIGAGFAGIAAGKKLQETDKKFVIVEARERIGGRVNTVTLSSGAMVDLGAQWIGPTQHHIWKWVKESKTETYDTYDSGKNILSWKNKISTYTGTIPKIDPISLIDLGFAIEKINKLCKEIPLEAPWTHPKAKEFDSITLYSWIEKNMFTKKAKHLFNIGVETVFAAESHEISFLHALFYCHSGDNMEALISIANGAQQTLLKGGTQGLLQKIAAPFQDKIYFNNPVHKIKQEDNGLTVETENLIIQAKKCISTLPPALLSSIRFSPILPQRKAQLIQRVPMGAAMKCFCIYEIPFWRKHGFSGQIVSDTSPVKVTFDCTDAATDKGVLLVFVEGNNARNFIELPESERKEKVLSELVKYLGEDAKKILEYKDKCWTEEEYSRGCYAGNMPTGVMTQFGKSLREPFMHLHFAGTETAMRWNGYMDGAIESGFRAADEVLGIN
jgi:monoamine oxidase